MKKIIYPFVVFSFLLLIASCSSDSNDDMLPDFDVTYTGIVKGIIDSKCLICHGNPLTNNAPMFLITYSEVKSAVQTRGLIGQVESGNMPKTGTNLTNSQVQAIKDWQAGGFIE